MGCIHSTPKYHHVPTEKSCLPKYEPVERRIYTREDIEQFRHRQIDNDYVKFRNSVMQRINSIPTNFTVNLEYHKWQVSVEKKWTQTQVEYFCRRFNEDEFTDLTLRVVVKKDDKSSECQIIGNTCNWTL